MSSDSRNSSLDCPYDKVVLKRIVDGVKWEMGKEEAIPVAPARVDKVDYGKIVTRIKKSINGMSKQEDPLQLFEKPNKTLYHLYRLIQKACQACYGELNLNENGLTGIFVEALREFSTASELRGEYETIRFRTHKVMDQIGVALSEAQLGADLVLLIAGDEILEKDGALVIWIQAKRPDKTPFNIKVARKNTQCNFRQASALARLDQPQKGSHALYLVFGHADSKDGVSTLWSSTASTLFATTPSLRKPCEIILETGPATIAQGAEQGASASEQTTKSCTTHKPSLALNAISMFNSALRFQEHVIDLILNSEGLFKDSVAFDEFLQEHLELGAKNVVCAFPAKNRAASELLLNMVEAMRTGNKHIQAMNEKQAVVASPNKSLSTSQVAGGDDLETEKKGRNTLVAQEEHTTRKTPRAN